MPPAGSEPLAERPVIVGSGPAGAFAAYFLAQHGYRPLVLERGRAVRERIADMRAFDAGGPHDPESNYLFGEGGAGTFSDGKLTCRAAGADVRQVLEILAECKGKPSIVYDHRPHLGSNRLPAVVKALRQRIVAWGGEFRFSCRLEDLDLADGGVRGLVTSSGYLPASLVVLAIGHSARDTYEMLLNRGVPMIPKPFQIGLRIEQPQEQVNRVQYGAARLEERLGSADYSLVARGPTNVFTFCMCAGGIVMPSVSEPGHFCTNGMSLSRRDSPFANSGLMITLEPADFGSHDVLAGMLLQRSYEQRAFEIGRGEYLCPIQTAGDFLSGRRTNGRPPSSYPRGVIGAELVELVPPRGRRVATGPAAVGSPLARRISARRDARRSRSARQFAGPLRARRAHARKRRHSRAVSSRRRRRLCGRHHQRRARRPGRRQGDHPALRSAGASHDARNGSITSTRLTTSSIPSTREHDRLGEFLQPFVRHVAAEREHAPGELAFESPQKEIRTLAQPALGRSRNLSDRVARR